MPKKTMDELEEMRDMLARSLGKDRCPTCEGDGYLPKETVARLLREKGADDAE